MRLSNRILNINNRRTSMRLCGQEWNALDEICNKEKMRRNMLIALIEDCKADCLGLTYATRLFLLLYYQAISSGAKNKAINKAMANLR